MIKFHNFVGEISIHITSTVQLTPSSFLTILISGYQYTHAKVVHIVKILIFLKFFMSDLEVLPFNHF